MDAKLLHLRRGRTSPGSPIREPVFCAACWYDLQGASYVGHCSECGASYDARPRSQGSVIRLHDVTFPTTTLLITFLAAWATMALLRAGVSDRVAWRCVVGAVLAIACLLLVHRFWVRLSRYLHCRGIRRRLQEEQAAAGGREADDAPAVPAGFGTSEFEAIQLRASGGRRIRHSVYCGACGYNLRTGRYIGRCPECGGEYDARPIQFKGVFVPGGLRFPLWDTMVTAFALLVTAGVVRRFLFLREPWTVIAGAGLAAISGLYVRKLWRDVARYVRFRGVVRRIARDDEDVGYEER